MGSYSFANSLNYTKVSVACSFFHNNQQLPSNLLSRGNFLCNTRSSSSSSVGLGFSGRKRSSQGLLIAAVAANGTGVSNSSTVSEIPKLDTSKTVVWKNMGLFIYCLDIVFSGTWLLSAIKCISEFYG